MKKGIVFHNWRHAVVIDVAKETTSYGEVAGKLYAYDLYTGKPFASIPYIQNPSKGFRRILLRDKNGRFTSFDNWKKSLEV